MVRRSRLKISRKQKITMLKKLLPAMLERDLGLRAGSYELLYVERDRNGKKKTLKQKIQAR